MEWIVEHVDFLLLLISGQPDEFLSGEISARTEDNYSALKSRSRLLWYEDTLLLEMYCKLYLRFRRSISVLGVLQFMFASIWVIQTFWHTIPYFIHDLHFIVSGFPVRGKRERSKRGKRKFMLCFKSTIFLLTYFDHICRLDHSHHCCYLSLLQTPKWQQNVFLLRFRQCLTSWELYLSRWRLQLRYGK